MPISAIPVPKAAVAVDVAVKSDMGSVITAVDAFTYLAEGSITSVVPNAGMANANEDPIVISGERLLGGTDQARTTVLGSELDQAMATEFWRTAGSP